MFAIAKYIAAAFLVVFAMPVSAERIDTLTWPAIEELLATSDLAIVPVGATEQTGPHNPTGSDYFIAEHVARAVGERSHVLVTPTVAVGVSAKHRQFPGTLWVPPQVFYNYVKYQTLSLAEHGIKKIVFVNGHGGNANTLVQLTGELRREHGVFAVVVSALPEDSPLVTDPSDVSHGGWAMTSVGLYLYPELVDLDGAQDKKQNDGIGALRMKGEDAIGPEGGPYGRFDADAVDLTDNGVLGGAGLVVGVTSATREKGERLIESRIDELVRLVDALKAEDAATLLPKRR